MDEELKTFRSGMETRIEEYVDQRTHECRNPTSACLLRLNTNLNVRMRKIEADVSNSDTASTTRLGNLENKITHYCPN